MEHDFLDKYADLNSPIHKLDPRVKVVSFLIFIFSVILTPPLKFKNFLFFFILILAFILISKVPLRFILKRSLIIIPFVFLVAIFIPFLKQGEIAGSYSFGTLHLSVSYGGLIVLWNVLIKSWLSVLSMIVLVSTTKFQRILKALESLGVPKVMVMVLSFFYRYVFVLLDEMIRMKRAKDSRSFNGGRIWHIKTIGNIIGILFIRSYERAERVYISMVSRGFTGKMRTIDDFKINKHDILFILPFLIILIIINVLVI
ncbi:MAG: cobalt ECF transporter T component CbiQ [Candidatus Hydrothermarchaeota archaeon]